MCGLQRSAKRNAVRRRTHAGRRARLAGAGDLALLPRKARERGGSGERRRRGERDGEGETEAKERRDARPETIRPPAGADAKETAEHLHEDEHASRRARGEPMLPVQEADGEAEDEDLGHDEKRAPETEPPEAAVVKGLGRSWSGVRHGRGIAKRRAGSERGCQESRR